MSSRERGCVRLPLPRLSISLPKTRSRTRGKISRRTWEGPHRRASRNPPCPSLEASCLGVIHPRTCGRGTILGESNAFGIVAVCDTRSMAPDHWTSLRRPGRDDPRAASVAADQGCIGLSRPGTRGRGCSPIPDQDPRLGQERSPVMRSHHYLLLYQRHRAACHRTRHGMACGSVHGCAPRVCAIMPVKVCGMPVCLTRSPLRLPRVGLSTLPAPIALPAWSHRSLQDQHNARSSTIQRATGRGGNAPSSLADHPALGQGVVSLRVQAPWECCLALGRSRAGPSAGRSHGGERDRRS
jgi:hypothetical protein